MKTINITLQDGETFADILARIAAAGWQRGDRVVIVRAK